MRNNEVGDDEEKYLLRFDRHPEEPAKKNKVRVETDWHKRRPECDILIIITSQQAKVNVHLTEGQCDEIKA